MIELRRGFKLASAAAGGIPHFYLRNVWLILGLSMVPTIQRFWLISQDIDPSSPVAIGSEVLAQASRAVLVWLILRLTFRQDPVLAPLSVRDRWHRCTAYIDRHLWAFITQFIVLAAAFVLLDALPNLSIASFVSAPDQPQVTAIVVAVKNPTVIAATFIWMASVARLLARDEDQDNEPSHTSTAAY